MHRFTNSEWEALVAQSQYHPLIESAKATRIAIKDREEETTPIKDSSVNEVGGRGSLIRTHIKHTKHLFSELFLLSPVQVHNQLRLPDTSDQRLRPNNICYLVRTAARWP